jgi:hypothetical protein
MSSPINLKKPKGKLLSEDDRMLNRIISCVRIKVEHAISGVKRCRIVKYIFRNTLPGMSDVVIEIACALHNLRVIMRGH